MSVTKMAPLHTIGIVVMFHVIIKKLVFISKQEHLSLSNTLKDMSSRILLRRTKAWQVQPRLWARPTTTRHPPQPLASVLVVVGRPKQPMIRYASSTTTPSPSSSESAAQDNINDNHDNKTSSQPKRRSRPRTFVPRKAAVTLTEQARLFFKQLLANPPRPDIIGIQLLYQQSSTGEPRMVYSFRFVTAANVTAQDEAVSLEVVENKDGVVTPKPPAEAAHDGLPKLYVAAEAFLKVLGATVDVNTTTVTPVLYDKEGNVMDPNS